MNDDPTFCWLVSLRNLESAPRAPRVTPAAMAFHISRRCREKYGFDQHLYTLSGNVIFPDFHAVRRFVQAMNSHRDLLNFPESAVKAGQINAMGLIDEILHHVLRLYREQKSPTLLQDMVRHLEEQFDPPVVDRLLTRFTEEFPPLTIYRDGQDVATYLSGRTGDLTHREIALEELILLWLANENPAFSPFLELFDDSMLERQTAYQQVFPVLKSFFDRLPPFGLRGENLLDMLCAPALASPHSLSGQLNFIRREWGLLLQHMLIKLLSSLDLVREEERMAFTGPGPTEVLRFDLLEDHLEGEPERFTPDREWMPRLVLIAKSTYVWLDQLASKYNREIRTLDQIPDEELDLLASQGFTGLWLIGVWERSRASRQIKRLCGNPEAMASAYSLADYTIAADLGGEAALMNLKERAWQRGIRLASDMVPNHMGIDSSWVTDHPDWFLSLDHSPYPAYSFNGPNLSGHDRRGVYIEDHYYERSDAAVVFKWVNFDNGDTRYVYHGNDGTSMPWNDTAQLNYLREDVREAVIANIVRISRMFPIIRFDAAMTLTKRHYQRLWFPEPGSGGDIPSRAGRGMPRHEFDRHMPREFWRDVVDRVAADSPDTLLLAEAFWLMEGYFVRSLGMHRVYNSAFMNMLKNEENDKFRTSIRNVLEFNPEILKRFVNFMNNPDEDTAVAQFGKGDKYLGCCVMLVTLPGLPMFGHGQVEGLTEKYGMEYQRAYWQETPDRGLIEAHERFIFPLMHKRYLFAGVDNFLLYDFFTADGHVNENVYAYSNRAGNERSLVVFHNCYGSTAGWIRTSTAYSVADGGDRRLVHRNLGDGLGLTDDGEHFILFRDQISGLEYIRNCRQIRHDGLYLELGAYTYQVFLDFREVHDDVHGRYRQLADYLGGKGVPDLDRAMRELILQPVHQAMETLVNPAVFRVGLAWLNPETPAASETETFPITFESRLRHIFREVQRFRGGDRDPEPIIKRILRELDALHELATLCPHPAASPPAEPPSELAVFLTSRPDQRTWLTLLGWLVLHRLGQLQQDDHADLSRSLIDEFLCGRILATTFRDSGLSEAESWRQVTLIKLLTGHQNWAGTIAEPASAAFELARTLFNDPTAQSYLGVNRYLDQVWFNQECLEELAGVLCLAGTLVNASESTAARPLIPLIADMEPIFIRVLKAAAQSRYRVREMLSMLDDGRKASPPAAGNESRTDAPDTPSDRKG